MKFFTLTAVIMTLIGSSQEISSSDQAKKSAADSADVLANLYLTLRNIIFPKSPMTYDNITHNRFVLMSPGKVLNYWDYFPGNDYEHSLLKQDSSAPEAMIPPSVMEKWFDVADVMVGGNPMGGVTGKSMAIAYETIITQMDFKGIRSKVKEIQARHNMALSYLTTLVPDPDDLKKNITRLSLYDRYHKIYTQTKLDMEEQINQARSTKTPAIEYELWFQRFFPSMNSKLEGIYAKWLAFGNKNTVELYKAYLDSVSAGTEIEKARMSLRASGVSSLDRTRTIYPVSFEPGNWYQYLLPTVKGPSRDMLLAKKIMFESQRRTYQNIIALNSDDAYKKSSTSALNKLQNISKKIEKDNIQKMAHARDTLLQCKIIISEDKKVDGPCKDLGKVNDEVVNATLVAASSKANLDHAKFLLNSGNVYNDFLNRNIESIDRQIKKLEAQLNASNPSLGGIVQDKNPYSFLNNTRKNQDSEWMSFEYNSDSSRTETTVDKKSLQVTVSLSAELPTRGVKLSAHFGKASASASNALNSASTKVSGEVLRVFIKRPWFKPSIFYDSSLIFSQRDELSKKTTYVSPGPETEKNLSDAIGGASDSLYLLPEYVTSFVMARNIKLEFFGVDSSSVSQMTQVTAGASVSGHYNCFSASASVGYSDTKQSVTADKTSTGMIITIPGAQIIGYYTNVLPRFPQSQPQ